MLALLAKELGIGTVIYNDIYDVSCHDFKVISEAVPLDSQFPAQGIVLYNLKYLTNLSRIFQAFYTADLQPNRFLSTKSLFVWEVGQY